jgi:hypothetical protein
MWDNEMGSRIATVLQLLVELPNLRWEGTIRVFDGGRLIEETGVTVIELADGTEVFYGSGKELHLTIRFPQGNKVEIRISEG